MQRTCRMIVTEGCSTADDVLPSIVPTVIVNLNQQQRVFSLRLPETSNRRYSVEFIANKVAYFLFSVANFEEDVRRIELIKKTRPRARLQA